MIIAKQVGRYHLLDRLAAGGMAEIFRAKTFDDQGEQHTVAIKRVLPHLSRNEMFLQMLVDEAKLIGLLNHPCIAQLYEFFRIGDEYFIAMEFVDGKDLRAILDHCRQKEFTLPMRDAAYIAIRTLLGLHAAHIQCDAQGQPLNIVHRDVSPSNIIVSFEGDIKLIDFGVAKAKINSTQTRAGVIKGKLKYMSPEQAYGLPLDGRSDVFSLGAVLYETVTLRPVFMAEEMMALVQQVRNAQIIPPSRINTLVPAALEEIIMRALQRQKENRYSSALEFAQTLEQWLNQKHPDYQPRKLGKLLQRIFNQEIEEDYRRLEEYLVDNADPTQLGENLIAEVLGNNAIYTKFNPLHPQYREVIAQAPTVIKTVSTTAPESAEQMHGMETMILDEKSPLAQVSPRIKTYPRRGAKNQSRRRRKKSPLDPALHGMSTQIIELKKKTDED